MGCVGLDTLVCEAVGKALWGSIAEHSSEAARVNRIRKTPPAPRQAPCEQCRLPPSVWIWWKLALRWHPPGTATQMEDKFSRCGEHYHL